MRSITALVIFFCLVAPQRGSALEKFAEDIIETSTGDLKITFIGHGTLMFTFGDQVIHVDPVRRAANYTQLPKADLILVTHEHGDHLDPEAIKALRSDQTTLILTETCARQVGGGTVLHNGEGETVGGLKVEAVPAYNLVHMRQGGRPYHAKGVGNGYVDHLRPTAGLRGR